MAAVRPVLTVFKLDGSKSGQVQTPAVFSAPIRKDIVHFVHTNMAKNHRQAYAAKFEAGMGYSAESWGTGRAVARIPRIAGGGTSRSGQGAFGNMCRGGRMYSQTKIWRRWHRKTSVNMKRYAVVAAVAATALPALVSARGHAIGETPECPLVVESAVESITKTKQALEILKKLGAGPDVVRAAKSRTVRTGVAKLRGRAHSCAKGPLVVYSEDNGITRAFRNLPGVDLVCVTRLNLLELAPGGHLGRFVIWTEGAASKLNEVFGTTTTASVQKKGYTLPRNIMSNPDLDRIINSHEIQSKLRAKRRNYKAVIKHNPLTNFAAKIKLNPYALVHRRSEIARQLQQASFKAVQLEAARAGKPVPIHPHVVKVNAQKAGAKKIAKVNYKRIVLGEVASNDETVAARFDFKRYREALKRTHKGPAHKGFDIATYKPNPRFAAKAATAAKIAENIAAKHAARREYLKKSAPKGKNTGKK